MINDIETSLALRPIHRRDVDKGRKRARRIVTQERRHPYDIGRGSRNRQLTFDHDIAGDRPGKRSGNSPAEGFERLVGHVVTARWSRCAESSFAGAAHHKAAPRRWADRKSTRL